MTETEKFDNLSHEWWDNQGSLLSLHKMNPVRFLYFKSVVGTFKGKEVIDIGCGGGILTEEIAKDGGITTGIDLSSKSIETAKKHALMENLQIEYRSIPIETLIEEKKFYDIVLLTEVLEHNENPEELLNKACRILKDDGTLFFSTVNRNLLSGILGIFMAEYILNIVPKGTHDYRKFIKPGEMDTHLRKAGLLLKGIAGMRLDLAKKDFVLSDDLSINYMGYAKKRRIK